MVLVFNSKYDTTLRRPSSPVENGGDAAMLYEELVSALRDSNGVGLAAPQLGYNLQAAVVAQYDSGGRRRPEYLYLVNPKVISASEPFIFKNESCLSFPNIVSDTIRHNKIVVKHSSDEESILSGLSAVIAAHEIDHLNGKLFFDNEVPQPYANCFCGSKEKFKFCCKKKLK